MRLHTRPHRTACAAVALAGAMLLAALPVRAVTPDEILKDPAMEARARVISQDLRCVVCQNQSIDDSNAPLAKDLRVLVRDRLLAGDSDKAVKDFIVARYGNFVLLKPPMQLNTLLLWLAPLLVLLAAGFALLRFLRHQETVAAEAPDASATATTGTTAGDDDLTPQEKKRLEALVKGSARS